MEGWLESFGLTLVKKRGWGVQVTGKERETEGWPCVPCSPSILMKRRSLGILKRSLRRKTGEHSGLVVERLLGMVELEKLSTVEEAVKKEIGHLPYSLADGAYIGLVVHLALAVERIERGESLHLRFQPAS